MFSKPRSDKTETDSEKFVLSVEELASKPGFESCRCAWYFLYKGNSRVWTPIAARTHDHSRLKHPNIPFNYNTACCTYYHGVFLQIIIIYSHLHNIIVIPDSQSSLSL